jgi:hypothetical protein
MAKHTVVLAIFDDEASADRAADSLKDSGLAHKDAIGVLVVDRKGRLKTDKIGKRSTGKGAGIGVVLGMLTPVGLGAAVVGGGLLGALHHKGLGLDDVDRDRISAELTNGKAAVGVLAPVDSAPAVAGALTELGGKPETHAVDDEVLDEAPADVEADRP